MFAWGVARELGLDLDGRAKPLESFIIPGGRGELKQHGALTVLNDGYNANPQSFASVIALAQEMRTGKTLVFVAVGRAGAGAHHPGAPARQWGMHAFGVAPRRGVRWCEVREWRFI